jgi:hypothetical protein
MEVGDRQQEIEELDRKISKAIRNRTSFSGQHTEATSQLLQTPFANNLLADSTALGDAAHGCNNVGRDCERPERAGVDDIQTAVPSSNTATDGANLLRHIRTFVRRFVSLSRIQADVVPLWVIHTHAFSAADATPYLAITSAEKQSGKTRLLELLETIVASPWFTGRVTAAVLIRKIDSQQPTLLLDESDAAFGGEKEYAEVLRGVLNTGHRRGGKASCCVGQGANISTRDFSTFCPKAIAGIGKLPDTVADRAIPIRLKRAAPGDSVARFRRREIETEARSLKQQIQSWLSSILPKLRDARPDLPEELTDRQQEGVEPLLAIADSAGEEWPEIARKALIQLCTEAQAADESIGRLLLSDIRQIFESGSVDRISSADLCARLTELETSPWLEWSRGKPLSPSGLARLLRGFLIVPHSIRLGDRTPKGYEREDFRDAFLRYLRIVESTAESSPTLQSATTTHCNAGAGSNDLSKCDTATFVAAGECETVNKNRPCCVVAAPTELTVETETPGIEEDL